MLLDGPDDGDPWHARDVSLDAGFIRLKLIQHVTIDRDKADTELNIYVVSCTSDRWKMQFDHR